MIRKSRKPRTTKIQIRDTAESGTVLGENQPKTTGPIITDTDVAPMPPPAPTPHSLRHPIDRYCLIERELQMREVAKNKCAELLRKLADGIESGTMVAEAWSIGAYDGENPLDPKVWEFSMRYRAESQPTGVETPETVGTEAEASNG